MTGDDMQDGGGDPSVRRDGDERLAFEQSTAPQALADLEGRFTAANQALVRLLGRSEDWFVGRDVVSVLHPLDDPGLSGQLSRLRDSLTNAISVEVVARDASGRSVQLLVEASAIHAHDGSPRFVALVAHELKEVRSAQERLARQERLYRAMSNRVTDAGLVTDADLVVIFVSPALLEMTGLGAVDVLATEATDLVHPDEQSEVRATVASAVAEAGRSERCLTRVRTGDDGWRWAEMTVVNSLADPDVGGLIFSVRDVTAELEAERALRESEARHRAIVETAQEGIVSIDTSGHVGLVNDRISEILGLSTDELRTSDRVREMFDEVARSTGDEMSGGAVRHEVRYARPDGEERVLSVSSTPLPATESGAGRLVMVSDVTEAHLLQESLRHQALHDHLTGLPNRYLFEDRLETAAARQERRPQGSTAVMYLDLDGFKEVNDSHGHHVGDVVLRMIGARLVDSVRGSDTVARLGGDEFAIICEGLDEPAARAVAERIRRQVFAPVEHDGQALDVGASIGIAMFPPHDPARSLALADTAMYRAKRVGGGGVVVFGVDEGDGRG